MSKRIRLSGNYDGNDRRAGHDQPATIRHHDDEPPRIGYPSAHPCRGSSRSVLVRHTWSDRPGATGLTRNLPREFAPISRP
jgi:hypothetical protein